MGQSAGDKAHPLIVDNLLDNFDILCLQETFLVKRDMEKVNCFNINYHGTGESTADLSNGLVRGRIPGGVASLCRKSLNSVVNVMQSGVD